jgi:cytochrome c oxidase cbb3-type subunit III
MRRLILVLLGSFCQNAFGQAGPYVRQEVDNAAASRGRQVYTQFCINCHGALAKGTEQGPDLIRSPLVLRDRLGDQVGPALKKLANHKADLTQAQVGDLTHFLKDQVEATTKNRNPVTPPNVLTGNAEAGQAYFNGTGKCNTCHSATGDLAGVGRKYSSIDLQQRFLFPRRTKPIQVTVAAAVGQSVTGSLERIDDFSVSLRDAAGEYRTLSRDKNVKVDLNDPLAVHNQMLDAYTDQDIHDVVRYLESLK